MWISFYAVLQMLCLILLKVWFGILQKSLQNEDGLELDRTHAYYYQVQTQIFIAKVDYCDFCVCTFPTDNEPCLHIERILPDFEFWSSCLDASSDFFKQCLLPEILGTWFSRKSIASTHQSQATKEGELASCKLFCKKHFSVYCCVHKGTSRRKLG